MADRANTIPELEYILGHSEREIRRLMRQAAILRPITERLLRSAGVRPGMRVLDLGCGRPAPEKCSINRPPASQCGAAAWNAIRSHSPACCQRETSGCD